MSDVWFEGLSLPVTDLDASSGFYVALGFVVEIQTPQFCLLRFGSGTLGLLQVGRAALDEGGRRQLRSLIQVELGTDDLDGFTVEFAEGVRGHNSTVPPRS